MDQQTLNMRNGNSQSGTEPPAFVTTSADVFGESAVAEAENSLAIRSSVIFICSLAASSNSMIGLL